MSRPVHQPHCPSTRWLHGVVWMVLVSASVTLVACSGSAPTLENDEAASTTTEEAETPPTDDDPAENPASTAPDAPNNAPDAPDAPEPVPYIPIGQPGDASAYGELINRLAQEVPAELRDQVPWPDLRHPDPVVAQTEIFDLWIWMAANWPDPRLVEAMAAAASPSRQEIVSIFGRKDSSGQLEEHNGQPYRAVGHITVTFESAGLPLWLGRDVPDDAVVIYYRDSAGPTDVLDRETREFLFQEPGVGDRAWLSIMVPTEVGWQLWRDQLIEPTNSELPIPDFAPPGTGTDRPLPEV